MVKAGVPDTIALERKRAWARNLPLRARMAALRRAGPVHAAGVARKASAALPSAEELGLADVRSMFAGSVITPRVGAFKKGSFEILFDAEEVAALGAKVRAVLALGLVPGAAAVARVVRRTDPPAVVALEEMRCRVRRCLRDEATGGGLQREDLLRGTATAAAAMSLTLWEQQNPWRAEWASSF